LSSTTTTTYNKQQTTNKHNTNNIRIGEFRAPTPVTQHDIHYGWGIQSPHPHHSTELQLRCGLLNSIPFMSSEHPLPLLNIISIRVGELRALTPITQHNFGIAGGDYIQFHF